MSQVLTGGMEMHRDGEQKQIEEQTQHQRISEGEGKRRRTGKRVKEEMEWEKAKRPGAATEQMAGRRVMEGETERVEKLMSWLLCDGACLFQCQAAFLNTRFKTQFFFLFWLFFCFLIRFSSFLSLLFVSGFGFFSCRFYSLHLHWV